MSLAFRRTCLLAALALLAVFAPLAQPARAATFTVTSLADSGVGTLRQAIIDANASAGADTITFSTAGTINLSSPLPALTGGGIAIDGTIPAGGTVPQIEIRGQGATATRGSGILLHSSNNTVRGLILNGFTKESFGVSPDYGGAGVAISGSATSGVASGNVIEYNYIGTNVAGNALGQSQSTNNTMAGVLLISGASSNTIRNNVIAGNNGPGIYLTLDRNGTDTYAKIGNIIRDNIIGLTANGSAALPNWHGIWVGDNSQDTVIGPGNTISGNGQGIAGSQPLYYGVFVQYDGSVNLSTGVFYPQGTLVKGNKIGTNPAGTSALPNKDGGVLVGLSTNTTIGGANATDANERNLIAGNSNVASPGVTVEDYPISVDTVQRNIGAVVQNNWIGLNANGTAALPNRLGVLLQHHLRGARIGPGNTISGNGNLAGGNQGVGVQVLVTSSDVTNNRQSTGNEISGNLIGTGPDGNGSFANQDTGIQLLGDTSANVIKNNRVTSNKVAGIDLQPNSGTNGPHDNTIQDNQIGTTAAGGTPGNGTLGIQLLGISNIVGPGNVIVGHTTSGVLVATSQNTIKGNTVRSNQIGIQISSGATGNLIGGSAVSDGNSVTNNSLYGIYVNGAGTTGNKITHTTTNANGDKGIALANGGNAPIAGATLSVTPPASGFTLTGNASGCTGGCTIELFTDDSPLDNEGPTFLPTAPLTGINGAFSVDITGCKHYLIFTLTDSAGNTSEFLSPTALIPQCVPSAPIVTLSDATPSASQSALPGASKTYQHTVTNTGTAAGALTITKTSSNGWTTVLDTSACPATLAAGAACNITLTVTVPIGALPGDLNTTTITAALAGAAATAQKTDTTTTLLSPGLTFTPDTQAKNTGPGQPVSYQHTLTNTGNGADTFGITVTLDASMAGWSYSVQPALPISLAASGSAQVTVTYTPTAGIASPPSYTATVRAYSANAPGTVFKDVTDVTTITSAAVPQISSVVTPSSIDPGNTVSIDYTITNVGNIDGTFSLALTKPAGWTAAPPTLTPVFIAKNTSTIVNIVLTSPGTALAGSYPVTFSATADATASKTDQITVKQQAALVWSPDPATFTRPPNQTFTDTLTLTNNGNFTDTVGLVATASQGWSVQPIPATVTLNPGASAPIDIRMTIPPGQIAGVSNTTSITATSSLPAVTATAHITTTIAAVPGVTLTPSSPTEQTIDAGKPMTYTFTLQNSGSITQSYTITRTAVPAGWNSTLTPLTTPTLQPGETSTITFTLTSPAGTPDGTQASVDITAACNENTCTPAKATVKLTVGPPFNVGVGGNCDGPALPGALVTCVHTVTNTGFSSDTYLITTISPLGWSTAVAPALLFLAPGASGTVTITLAVPTSADAGLQHVLTVTARSTALPSVSQTLTDTTTVLQVGGVSFSPSRTTLTTGGQLVQFEHTVLNTGNGMDTYTITATQALNWSITIVPTTTNTLPRGTYQTIQISIQVPAGTPSVVSNRIRLRATSTFAPAIFEEIEDVIGSPQNVNVRWNLVYLPLIAR